MQWSALAIQEPPQVPIIVLCDDSMRRWDLFATMETLLKGPVGTMLELSQYTGEILLWHASFTETTAKWIVADLYRSSRLPMLFPQTSSSCSLCPIEHFFRFAVTMICVIACQQSGGLAGSWRVTWLMAQRTFFFQQDTVKINIATRSRFRISALT